MFLEHSGWGAPLTTGRWGQKGLQRKLHGVVDHRQCGCRSQRGAVRRPGLSHLQKEAIMTISSVICREPRHALSPVYSGPHSDPVSDICCPSDSTLAVPEHLLRLILPTILPPSGDSAVKVCH